MPDDDDSQQWRTEAMITALADIDRVHASAAGIVRTTKDLDLALALANVLVKHLQVLFEADAELRLGVIGEVWRTRELSLAALGQIGGISKARADQLVRRIEGRERKP